MRRTALVLAVLVSVLGVVALTGCGGDEEATPTPGGTDTTATETTETDTTATDTTETDTTETTTDTVSTGQGDPVAGKEVYLGAGGCGSCHTLADAGTTGTVGPVLDDTQPSYDLAVDRVTNGAGLMPPFSGTLTEQQIQDVAAYVSSAAGG